jgi:putative transposase
VIRNAMRFVSRKGRKKIAASMRAIYIAPNVDAAELALAKLDRISARNTPACSKVLLNGCENLCVEPLKSMTALR